jgi:hypothetical protein
MGRVPIANGGTLAVSCDPDLAGQQLTARRALRELERVRIISFVDTNGDKRQVVTRPNPFQAKILAAIGVDISAWRSRVA